MKFIDLKAQYDALKDTINTRIQRVLDHGCYIMGPEVRELEQKLEAYTQAKHCITVASGTEALLITLLALEIQSGDEIITTPFTFAATAEMIVLLGAVPVFVDIDPETCNIDVNKIEAAITPKTKAIMPVSLYGQPSDMQPINAIAVRHGHLAVIEDAAQSFGATYQNHISCNLSTVGCTSFFPSKPLGCYGDGGAIFTSHDRLAQAMREIRIHGQERRYHHTRIGVGGRMDTIQCAIVLAKLTQFNQEVDRRQVVAQYYLNHLSKIPAMTLPTVRCDRTSVWGQFTLQLDERDRLISELTAEKIPTAVHYPLPLHRQIAYKKCCRVVGTLVHAESAARRVLSLPMHPFMDRATQDRIIGTIHNALA
jgi:UDP-2-acetamido-2-deoxy-ribo-hexuluronate aminotransferase